MKSVGYYNGEIGLVEELKIPMTDRAMFFGDGVYDVTIGTNHKMFAIEEHLERFYSSLNLLEIAFKMSKEELKLELQKCVDLIDSNGNIFIYWQSTRGNGKRMHVFPEAKPTLMITITELDNLDIFTPIKLITMEDTRFLHCNIKSLNLIPSVIASQRAKEAGCQEAVLHRQNSVTECAHSNLAILKNGTFITTPLSNLILPGITRKHLIELCIENNIPAEEREMKLDEIFEADEVIVLSSTKLCTSACEIDGKGVGNKANDLLKKLRIAYIAKYEKELGEALLSCHSK